jgi:hypothetical protein
MSKWRWVFVYIVKEFCGAFSRFLRCRGKGKGVCWLGCFIFLIDVYCCTNMYQYLSVVAVIPSKLAPQHQ